MGSAQEVKPLAKEAYVTIENQPQSKIRFRYKTEGSTAGAIYAKGHNGKDAAYPSIKIHNYEGGFTVVVSCVTRSSPYRAHPHQLVGQKYCAKGVYTTTVKHSKLPITFPNLGIQHCKKSDIEKSLQLRKDQKVDPFECGFDHMKGDGQKEIDLKAVRLCFQVLLPDVAGQFNIPLQPVVSDVITDSKAAHDLKICHLSHREGSVAGGQEVTILCEKVTKDDIEVHLFEEDSTGLRSWEDFGHISTVHHQVAIVFEMPEYKVQNISEAKQVNMELRRLSDSSTSEPVIYTYLPREQESHGIPAKKRKKAMSKALDIISNGLISGNTNAMLPSQFGLQQTPPLHGAPLTNQGLPPVTMATPVTNQTLTPTTASIQLPMSQGQALHPADHNPLYMNKGTLQNGKVTGTESSYYNLLSAATTTNSMMPPAAVSSGVSGVNQALKQAKPHVFVQPVNQVQPVKQTTSQHHQGPGLPVPAVTQSRQFLGQQALPHVLPTTSAAATSQESQVQCYEFTVPDKNMATVAGHVPRTEAGVNSQSVAVSEHSKNSHSSNRQETVHVGHMICDEVGNVALTFEHTRQGKEELLGTLKQLGFPLDTVPVDNDPLIVNLKGYRVAQPCDTELKSDQMDTNSKLESVQETKDQSVTPPPSTMVPVTVEQQHDSTNQIEGTILSVPHSSSSENAKSNEVNLGLSTVDLFKMFYSSSGDVGNMSFKFSDLDKQESLSTK